MSRSQLRIGEVARLLGVTPKTIRHYHRRGLIAEPPRSESDYRLYTAHDLLRLRHIRQLQAMGLSLAQIKAIFDAPNPDAHLQTVLAALRDDLHAEHARIAERLRRVDVYLSDNAPLSDVLKPTAASPTYTTLAAQLPPDIPLSEAMRAFDQQIFAELDSFAWDETYQAVWRSAAQHFTSDSALRAFVISMAQRIESAADLAPDDPTLELWARETAESPHLQQLGATLATLNGLPTRHTTTMGDLIQAVSAGQLTAAQHRLLTLIQHHLDAE